MGHVRAFAGEGAVDCGRFMEPGSWGRPAYDIDAFKPGLDCALDAARRRVPFWLVQRTRGFDSWTATGLVARADGDVFLVRYDYPYGDPHFRLEPCEEPEARVDADGFPSLSCRHKAFR